LPQKGEIPKNPKSEISSSRKSRILAFSAKPGWEL